MTLVEIEKIIEVDVGEINFKLLSQLGIDEEFSGIGEKIIELYDLAMKGMKNGNFDPKLMMEVCEKFDIISKELSNRVVFGKDQNGMDVTLEQLYGELKSVRPEYIPYKAIMLMIMWIAQKKLSIHYQEKSGKKLSHEVVHIGGI